MKTNFCLISFCVHAFRSVCLNVHAAAFEMYRKYICCVSEVKKGGRKRKAKATEPKQPKKPAAKKEKPSKSKGKQEKITDTFKVKRKVDRFNGVSEAELLTKTLPDILTFDLDIVIVSSSQRASRTALRCHLQSTHSGCDLHSSCMLISVTYTARSCKIKYLNCFLCV